MALSEQEMKKWIDSASYEDLLTRWRFSESGNPFFQGDVGTYYIKVMAEKRRAHKNPSAVSRWVGWNEKKWVGKT